MEFNPQPKIKPSSAPAIGVTIVLLALFNGAYFLASKLSSIELGALGHRLGISTDLSACATLFSVLTLAQTIFMFAVCSVSALGILAAVIEIYTHKRKFSEFGKLLAIAGLLPLLVLLPWLTGDIFMLKRFDLGQACLRSVSSQLYGPYLGMLLSAGPAWLALMLPYAIIRIVRSGKKPGDLPDDPAQREAVLQMKAKFAASKANAAARGKSSVGMFIVKIAIVAGLPVAGWLGISLLRAYHNLVWEPHTVRLVEVGARCTLQSRLKGGQWETQTVYDCVSNANANPTTLQRKVGDAAGKEYRLLNMPTIKMALQRPDGTEEIIWGRRDVFMPVPVPMGTQTRIYRDPNDSKRIDRVFGARDVKQISQRLAIVLAFVLAIFFLVIRPKLRKSNSTRGEKYAAG